MVSKNTYGIVFISSTGRYELGDVLPEVKKKFKVLSQLGVVHQIGIGKGNAVIEGVHLHLLPKRFFVLRAWWKAWHIWKNDQKIDYFYSQSPLVDGLVGVLLRATTGAKLIIGIHGNWESDLRAKGRRTWLPNKLAKFCLKRADMVRVISQSTKSTALNYIIPEKIHNVAYPAYFDAESFLNTPNSLPNKEDSVLFIGSMTKTKGADMLPEIARLVRKEIPYFKLYAIGGEGSSKDVEYLGRQPQSKVIEYMDKVKAVIMPSRSEGLGRVALEAMARGLPVIGSNVEGLRETVPKGGFLVEPNPEAFAKKIIEIIEGAAIPNEGQEYVKSNYSSEKYLSNYKTLLETTEQL